ncbi:MAG TPA: hypothetical protein VFV24_03725, partial [Candidatus Eisenbacteria bacterium]|nr:hypothetical protein [Candidatus Eisenbacteria bacterium]
PLATGQESGGLHLYAYPIDGRWVEGAGGEKRDNFSPASPGEVTWKDARSGVEPWPAPGGLGPGKDGYAHSALAMALIRGDERTVLLGGPALAAHVASRASEGRTLDLLLKLDDGEEDRLGTEIGLMTSEFGDEHDAHSKRPRLDVVVALPQGGSSRIEGFTIEPGQDHRLDPVLHRGSTVLLAADLEAADGGVPPGIFVRGGAGEPSESTAWVPLTSPVERRWDWSQFLVRSPMTRLPIGDSLEIRLREFWVRPGPRERQVPELVLVSPSGELQRLAGHPGEGDEYRLPIRPEEPGLWRYGWSFRPTPNRPPESHRGEGLFYVSLPGPEDPGASARVERWSQELLRALRAGRVSKASAQAQVNALCRWVATRAASAPSSERPALDRMVRETRAALAKSSS